MTTLIATAQAELEARFETLLKTSDLPEDSNFAAIANEVASKHGLNWAWATFDLEVTFSERA